MLKKHSGDAFGRFCAAEGEPNSALYESPHQGKGMSKGNIIREDGNEEAVKEEDQEAEAAPQPQAALPQGGLIRGPIINVYLHLTCRSAAQKSPQRAECTDDDDYFLRNRDSLDTYTDSNLPCKRRHCARVASKECKSTLPKMRDLFEELPDELLLNVFRFMPRARDRASCASVCKRCLNLQSLMQRKDFYIKDREADQRKPPKCSSADKKKDELINEGHSQESPPGLVKDVCDAIRVERQPQWAVGDLSRSLEGKEATDLRLAAIAVGTGDRGGLGKLCIKGRGFAGVSDAGLSAIGHSCAALQSLILWDCPNITSKSITLIGERCRLLRKFEVVKCPLIGDPGVLSIAKHAISLSMLSLDQCPLIGDTALHAVSKGCQGLTHLSVKNCPLVGNNGLCAVFQNCRKLQHLRLQGLQVSDGMLMWVTWHCNALSTFGLNSLDYLTEDGFLSFCKFGATVKGLRRLAITNCPNFNDNTLAAVGTSFKESLKQISLIRCEGISDQGIMDLVQIMSSLEILHVERCTRVTGVSVVSALSSTSRRLKEIHFKACEGIKEHNVEFPSSSFERDKSVVRSICLADCGSVGDACLFLVGRLCSSQLRDLDLTGLTHITDTGVVKILKWFQFVSVNITGCEKLTNVTVWAIAQKCGGSLKSFVLDGCRSMTDVGLKAISKYCVALEDLHMSECSITDVGVKALVSKTGSTLVSLNLSRCRGVTSQIRSVIEEGCPNLRDLNLKGCGSGFDKEGDKYICEADVDVGRMDEA